MSLLDQYCTKCGFLLRVMFNNITCANGCRAPAARDWFPQFWSRYATPPRILTVGAHQTIEDLLKLADCVVAFDLDGARWNGTARLKNDEVLVIASRVWARTVGKVFTVKGADAALLTNCAEAAPEDVQKRYGKEFVAVLVRT